MDNQNKDEIIQFGNTLNPNYDNSTKFNDLSDNNSNSQVQQQVKQNINNEMNNQIPDINQQVSQNINTQLQQVPNNNQTINQKINNQVQSDNQQINQSVNIQVQSSMLNNNQQVDNKVTINNQEVVNLDANKDDNKFRMRKKEETKEEKENKKNAITTIIIIVIIFLAIFGIIKLANVFLSNSAIDNNNSLMFINNAESFINDAKSLVKKDDLTSRDLNYAPSCTDDNKRENIITLTKILANVNDIKDSPFGGKYNLNKSYVKVIAKEKNNSCEYEYYIYLTDDNYYIGSESNPILSTNLTKDEVKKYSK